MKTCMLCGDTSYDVETGLVEWRTPRGKDRFTSLPRCRNRRACRARVEEVGDEWEVWDPITSTGELVKP